MLISNQIVKVPWAEKTQKHYINLGYSYTKLKDLFDCKVEDLTKSSIVKVKVKCDYCGQIFEKTYLNYNQQHDDVLGDACKCCRPLKQKYSNLLKYGVDNTAKLPSVQNKMKQTCLERYGVENIFASDECKNRIQETLYKYGKCKTSSQQVAVFKLLKDIYGNCELNYPCSKCCLDCMVEVNGYKIDVEYDGAYWHQDEQRDRRRDEFVKSQGYKVLRIKDGHKIPTKEQIIEAIDSLINNDYSYKEILLDIR